MSLLIRLFGVTAFAAVVCELVRQGPVVSLFDFRAMGCIFGGLVGMLLVGTTQKQWQCAWRFLFAEGRLEGDEDRAAAATWFQIGRRGALASGVLTYAIGVIFMLSDISSPAMLGAGLATSLLSVVYAVVLSEFFFFPFASAASAGLQIDPRDRFSLIATFATVASIAIPTALLATVF